MYNGKISTSELLRGLFKTRNIAFFVKRHEEQMRAEPLHTYLKRICKERGVLPAHIIAKSFIDRTFGHQIFNGTRKPSRDKAILLAFGFEMDYSEVQELLRAANKRLLHPKVRRDAVIIYALKNKKTIDDTQITLFDLMLPLLGEDRNE